jgi:hypothetical protein
MKDSPVEPLSPQTYLSVTVRCLWDNLPRIVLAGLWFSLLAAPAFVLAVLGLWGLALLAGLLLVGPSWAALLQWEAVLLEGKTPSWSALLQGWLRLWLPAVRLGVLAVFPLVLVRVLNDRLAADAPLWLAGLSLGAWLYALLWLAIGAVYILPAMALHGWALHMALRNGWVLASRFPGNTVGLIALFVLFYLAVVNVSGGLIFLLPAVAGLFVANNLRLVVGLS